MVNSKKGIAMIELIFALVIMGIVLMSAPMLIQQSIRSGNVALQQEAIVAAASQTAIILSMHWDENNNNNQAGITPMFDVNRTPFDFNESTTPLGLTNITGRNHTEDKLTLPATSILNFGRDIGEIGFSFDDIDDYHNSSLGISVLAGEETSTDVGDYLDVDLNITTSINYAQDRPQGTLFSISNVIINPIGAVSPINSTSIGGLSNIKFIRVNLTTNKNLNDIPELDKNITFEAFSSNIGTFKPQGRDH